jgi:hypothetical protein
METGLNLFSVYQRRLPRAFLSPVSNAIFHKKTKSTTNVRGSFFRTLEDMSRSYQYKRILIPTLFPIRPIRAFRTAIGFFIVFNNIIVFYWGLL